MDKSKLNKYANKRMDIDSILFGLYLMIPALVLIPPAFVPSLTGRILTPMYIVVSLIIFVRVFFKQYFSRLFDTISLIIVLFCLFMYFLLTQEFAVSTLLFTDFLAYVIMPLFITCVLPISIRNVFRVAIISSTPGILVLNQIFELGGYNEEALSLGACYAFLIPVLASIIYLFFFLKEDSFLIKVLMLICIAINAVFLYKLVIHGSRGPLLSLLLLPMFLFTISNKGLGLKIYKIRFIVTLVSVILLVVFFLPAIVGIDTYFESIGVEIQAINKIILLNSQMDITNGRTNLINATLAEIPNNILFGHGLSTSKSVVRIQYPHNCILQLLFDGGVFLFLVLTIPMIRRLNAFFRYCNSNQYAFVILLFLACFPGALLSGDMWNNPRLWFFVGVTFSLKYSNEINKYHVKTYC